ncbi:MAG TPA: hypothetical protein VF533_14785 [Solirubrobacteraceae bacterium]|jgi:hypothetical protein
MRAPEHDELPAPFADLREQFRAAAAREIEIERRVAQQTRRGRRRVVVAVALGLMVPAAGVAGATRIFAGEAKEAGADRDVPVADAGVIASSAVPDPHGGPPWALKVFANRQGDDCVAFGRLRDGKLGTYQRGLFRPHPERMPGMCDHPSGSDVLLAASVAAMGDKRTLIYGLSRERAPITVEVRGRRHVLRPGALGTFLLVFDGVLPPQSATVTWREDGRRKEFRAP